MQENEIYVRATPLENQLYRYENNKGIGQSVCASTPSDPLDNT